MGRGLAYGLCAYVLWGFSPVFWKALEEVPPVEVLGHRVLWTVVLLMVVHLARRSWRQVLTAASSPRVLGLEALAALLLGVNWLTWVWAMNSDRVVEGSLGYFINPLVSVFLGVVLLGESLRRAQWSAVVLATAGVVWLTVHVGALPWVSLVLGFTFGFYGLLKKKVDKPPLVGLGIEVSLLLVPALAVLVVRASDGSGAVGRSGTGVVVLLVASGAATGVPLLLFGAAARRVPLSVIGMMQYLAPTINLVLGVAVYGEQFDRGRLAGFVLIWLAVAVFAVDAYRYANRSVRSVRPDPPGAVSGG